MLCCDVGEGCMKRGSSALRGDESHCLRDETVFFVDSLERFVTELCY